MNKSISLAILAGGLLLILFGVGVSQSVSSDISRFFTGSPTEKAMVEDSPKLASENLQFNL